MQIQTCIYFSYVICWAELQLTYSYMWNMMTSDLATRYPVRTSREQWDGKNIYKNITYETLNKSSRALHIWCRQVPIMSDSSHACRAMHHRRCSKLTILYNTRLQLNGSLWFLGHPGTRWWHWVYKEVTVLVERFFKGIDMRPHGLGSFTDLCECCSGFLSPSPETLLRQNKSDIDWLIEWLLLGSTRAILINHRHDDNVVYTNR